MSLEEAIIRLYWIAVGITLIALGVGIVCRYLEILREERIRKRNGANRQLIHEGDRILRDILEEK